MWTVLPIQARKRDLERFSIINFFLFYSCISYWTYCSCDGVVHLCCANNVFVSTAFGVLIVIMFVGTSSAIGMCHRRFGLLVKILPHAISGPKYETEEESIDSHQERMQEFRLL